MNKENINIVKEIIYNNLNYIYCNNCRYLHTDYCFEVGCDRKNMGWKISDEFAKKIAIEILDKLDVK